MEWGEEKVEALSPDRLEIQVMRPHGAVRAELPQPEDAPAGSVAGEPVVDLSPLGADASCQPGAPL